MHKPDHQGGYMFAFMLAGLILMLGSPRYIGGVLGVVLASEGLLALGFVLFRFGFSMQPSDDLFWWLGWPLSVLLDVLWLVVPEIVFFLVTAGLASFLLGLISAVGRTDPRVKELRATLFTIVALPLVTLLDRLVLSAWRFSFWQYAILFGLIGGWPGSLRSGGSVHEGHLDVPLWHTVPPPTESPVRPQSGPRRCTARP